MSDFLQLVDVGQKLGQLGFFLVTSILAILTYRNALRGFWSPVNSEYYKRVIDSLSDLSRELYSEFDPSNGTSPWFEITDEFAEEVRRVNRLFIENKDAICEGALWGDGFRDFKIDVRLRRLRHRLTSDPFVPDVIRDQIIDFLESRIHAHALIVRGRINQYREELVRGVYPPDDKNHYWLWNQVNGKLYDSECGYSDLENSVHELRLGIKRYMNRFAG